MKMIRRIKVPGCLNDLPQMAFSQRPAPNHEESKRLDIAYGIQTSEQLAAEFDRREARLK
ncbi:hypothetical protein CcrColossus_gp418 [Caulobacter phage CcrColossus]|uniref:Uncharacterized protein n=1 Tax=Caulobacter phage CcrColossus TaxID=1211640 RepID=K4JWK1_9CAUD|nr:hypothetical protein CcrColossus_gp418 [Caulobacter phage CcrColossus]AFU88288.1 hypothetical protein CcrColossus_gp418 [Caulobacter phage CcrColossus]